MNYCYICVCSIVLDSDVIVIVQGGVDILADVISD